MQVDKLNSKPQEKLGLGHNRDENCMVRHTELGELGFQLVSVLAMCQQTGARSPFLYFMQMQQELWVHEKSREKADLLMMWMV